MRVIAKWFPRGEIRLIRAGDKPKRREAPAAERPFINSSEFQDRYAQGISLPRSGYGAVSKGTTFGANAKGCVRDAGALLEREGLEKLEFITLTLPGGSDECLRACAAWSGWIVSRLTQWFRDRFPGSPWIGVWEWQKRGALHLHICIKIKWASLRWALRALIKARWIALLRGIEKRQGIDMFARKHGGTWADKPEVVRANSEPVRKSVRRYLGKYLSKQRTKARADAAFPPSRWWFISRALSSEVQSERRHLQAEQLSGSQALELFARLFETVTAKVEFAASYRNPMDSRFEGFVLAGEALADRNSFVDTSLLMAAWGLPFTLSSQVAANLSDIAAFFEGVELRAPPAVRDG